MKKLKLSEVYTALIVAGAISYSPTILAVECGKAITIKDETNASLSQCNYYFDENEKEPWLTITRPFLLENSKFEISNSDITMRNFSSSATLLEAKNSILNIDNSKINTILPPNSVLELKNTPTTITNSTLTSTYATLIDLNGGNLNIENSTLKVKDRLGELINIWLYDSNKINLKNVTSHSNQIFETWLYSSEPNKTLHINIDNSQLLDNSSLISFIGNQKAQVYLTASNNSTISGGASIGTPQKSSVTLDITLNDSVWSVVKNYKDSSINNLYLNNSTVNLVKSNDSFHTFTIYNDLSGNGNFTLNTDLASQQSDKIVVTGSDSGSFGLNINDSGNEPNAANGKVTLVETVTGTAQFALLGNDYVDAGAYRYRLNQEGNNWVLSNKADESSKTTQPEKPVEQPKPIVPVEEKPKPATPPTSEQTTEAKPTLPVVPVMPPEQPKNPSNTEQTTEVSPTQPTVPVTPTEQPKPTTPESVVPPMVEKALSEKSNALVSLRQAQLALVESNLEGLHQRLGELKNGEKGNVWVRNVNSRNKFDSTRTASDSHSSGFEQDVHSVQLGADVALTDNIRLGGFVGNARSDVDFDGKYGSGKVKTQSLGLYGTYLANNGFYWDNVAKYEYVKSESASTGKRKYNAYTLSTEIGRIHQLGQGWTVIPQIQAAWTRLSSQSDEERLSALTARAGVRVAKAIEFDGWKLQPYAEVNGITTQTNQSAVRVNQYLFDVAESKGRIQTALGINAAMGNHRFGLEGSVTNGKYLDQPYKVQAVYRYSW